MVCYVAKNNINGHVYIGKTTVYYPYRKRQHLHEAFVKGAKTCFHSALRTYGADAFSWHITPPVNTREELNELEMFLIQEARALYGKYGVYNMTQGGAGCVSPSQEGRRKMSEADKTGTQG